MFFHFPILGMYLSCFSFQRPSEVLSSVFKPNNTRNANAGSVRGGYMKIFPSFPHRDDFPLKGEGKHAAVRGSTVRTDAS